MPTTDHAADIARLRRVATFPGRLPAAGGGSTLVLPYEWELAADLLDMHDRCAISLDKWSAARRFVEARIEHNITENGV